MTLLMLSGSTRDSSCQAKNPVVDEVGLGELISTCGLHLHRVSSETEITAPVEVTINQRPPAVPASGPIQRR